MLNPAAADGNGSRRRIVHIITGLSRGGAEAILYRLVAATSATWDSTVISLADEGYYGAPLRRSGCEVLTCRMRESGQFLPGLLRLQRFLRHTRPDVVQTWMYHADLLGGLCARLTGIRAVLWGIRNLRFSAGGDSLSARIASSLCARLSGTVPATIVSCSARAAAEHVRRGYASEHMIVIPNGYDLTRLHIDQPAGAALRASFGIEPAEFLIGMVARWDPLKDHANFLSAMGSLLREQPHIRVLLVGPGMQTSNAALQQLLALHTPGGRVLLAGARDDIPAVMNALDLHVLSSCSEAFPNVLAEAMACGTPCVTTDVGDAAAIVGELGWCVPPRDPVALADAVRLAIRALAGQEGAALRAACRARIVEHFTSERMVSAFEGAWLRALRGTRRVS
jgi:glycosyltransferase involved in cell wall biosynthesis